jgi:hypothetical protein
MVSGNFRMTGVFITAVLAVIVAIGSVDLSAQPLSRPVWPDSLRIEVDVASSADRLRLHEALLLPGRQQLHGGARAKGALIATAAFLSVLSLGGTQWLYARETEQAASYQAEYEEQSASLYPLKDFTDAQGYVTNWVVYQNWTNAYQDARRMRNIRNYALIGVGAIYVINATDVLLTRRRDRHLTASVSCAPGGGCMLGGRLEF